jgi:S-adenosylmethionine:diacylglycerol 3-amino-3-carboxypropyl transferase
LQRREAIPFLGYRPAPAAQRRAWLGRVREELPAEVRAFWDHNHAAVAEGAVWAGRYERYVRRLVRLLQLLLRRRIDQLLRCTSVEEQCERFRESFDTRWLRLVFEVAFHPRVYAHRGMDPRSLKHVQRSSSVGQRFFDRFEMLCTATPIADNHLLQLHLQGAVRDDATVPAYLSPEGYRTVRESIDRLTLRRQELHHALAEAPAGQHDAFHLSNLPDWMSASGFNETMELLAGKSVRPGRAVWRFLHIDRPVPAHLTGQIRVDRAFGDELQRRDRFPLYGIVPAVIAEAI